MSTTYHLAVDLGATSGRTILASYDGDQGGHGGAHTLQIPHDSLQRPPLLEPSPALPGNPQRHQEKHRATRRQGRRGQTRDHRYRQLGLRRGIFLPRRLARRPALLLPRQPHRGCRRAVLRENAARKGIREDRYPVYGLQHSLPARYHQGSFARNSSRAPTRFSSFPTPWPTCSPAMP